MTSEKIISVAHNRSHRFMSALRRRRFKAEAAQKGNGINAYWWNCTPNFGDQITPLLLRKYGFAPIYFPIEQAQFVSTGSILDILPEDYNGIILGSGFIQPTASRRFPNAKVLAVRGEKTLKLIGSCSGVVLGDPGLLISSCIDQRKITKRYRIGIIPHYIERGSEQVKTLKNRFGDKVRIIDVRRSPQFVAREVARCECILSSSLHGLITADSLGIPNGWLLLSDSLKGGEFKFQDYYSSLGMQIDPVEVSGEESLAGLIAFTSRKPESKIGRIKKDLEKVFAGLEKELKTRL